MVITVQCPSCDSSFPVDSKKIPEKGVSVRCSSCSEVFRVEHPVEAAPAPEPPPPPPAAPEPEALPPPPAAPEPVIDEAPTFEVPTFEREADTEPKDRDVDAETDFSIGTGEQPVVEEVPADEERSDWVFETEQHIDPDSLHIEPMETDRSRIEDARDEASFFGGGSGFEPEGLAEIAAPEPTIVPPEEPPHVEEAPIVGGFTFGKRDPKDKARRLARVLVSDMIMYNPDRHQRALANGTLREDFEEEIQKSWKEYVEQVGEEMATGNDFWTEALNDVLAKGERVF